MHGDIGYKFCWLLPFEDQTHTPLGHESPSRELKALDAWKLKVVGDMSYSRSWAYDSRSYKELRVLEDMKELGSHELRPLYAMNNSGL